MKSLIATVFIFFSLKPLSRQTVPLLTRGFASLTSVGADISRKYENRNCNENDLFPNTRFRCSIICLL